MKKIMTKVICGALLFVMIFGMGITGGCARESFNAELIDNAKKYMTEEYKKQNMITDKSSFRRIIRIIKTQDEYEQAFNGFPKNVNFDKEMLIVVLFNFEPTYVEDKKHISYVLHSVEKHNNVLNVNIRYKCLDNQENIIIEQESLVIKMNKTNFKYVKYFGECIKY